MHSFFGGILRQCADHPLKYTPAVPSVQETQIMLARSKPALFSLLLSVALVLNAHVRAECTGSEPEGTPCTTRVLLATSADGLTFTRSNVLLANLSSIPASQRKK
jgi:hypothetical protein